MSSQFIKRVADYIANEVLVKGLANSKTFQRFAVRTNKNLQDIERAGTEHLNKAFDSLTAAEQQQIRNSTTMAAGPPTPPLAVFRGFVAAFFKEIRKDLGLGK
jgi:predicted KAP-like P-loop ATPase